MSVLILGLLTLSDADIFISILYVEKRRFSKVNQLTQSHTASVAEQDTSLCVPDFRVFVSFLSPQHITPRSELFLIKVWNWVIFFHEEPKAVIWKYHIYQQVWNKREENVSIYFQIQEF